MLAAARALGAGGFRVFQIKPEGSRDEDGKPNDNTPAHRGWQSEATTMPTAWPLNANIGIATGKGLLVVDIDPRNGGDETLQGLELVGYELPATLTANTPSGGVHFYYRHDPALHVNGGTSKLGPGIDIKAGAKANPIGGYVVAPPSRRAGKGEYRWANDLPIAECPQWLLAKLEAEPREAFEARMAGFREQWAERAASTEITPYQQRALDYISEYYNRPGAPRYARGPWVEQVMLPLFGAGLLDVARDHCDKAPNGDANAADELFANEERSGTVVRASLDAIVAYARELGFEESDPAIVDEFEVIETALAVALPKTLALRKQKDGRPLAELSNVLAVMRAGACSVDVRHDSFRDELMIAPRGTDQWRAVRDTDVTAIQEAFERAGFKPVAREVMRNALHKLGEENAFDSATHWLQSLRWDGQQRVAGFLARYFGAEDTEYTRAVSVYLWTALAGRVLEPGCQADMVPVLVGDQGQRKSSALAAMVPAPEHFTGFGFDKIGHPDTSRRMRGVLLGEIAELKGINSRDIESIKDWITRRHERWTPKYQEFDAVFPRRLVFVGTTNNQEFLADKTGNRRWLPVTVGHANSDAIQRDREQLWAEGRDLFRASGVAWQAAEELAPAVHDEYVISDSWEDAIADWLARPGDFDDLSADAQGVPRGEQPFTVVDVLRGALGFQTSAISKAPEMRAAEILREMGYTRKQMRVNGLRKWIWTR